MKFNNAFAVIFITAFVLCGLIYVAVDRISQAPHREAHQEKMPELMPAPAQVMQNIIQEKKSISPNDNALILAIANLSDEELNQEFSLLAARLKQENIVTKLEQGFLDALEKSEAKKLIERYALLGLEGTRRKYVPVEPELKDAVYAHRDSLKDIRKLTDQY